MTDDALDFRHSLGRRWQLLLTSAAKEVPPTPKLSNFMPSTQENVTQQLRSLIYLIQLRGSICVFE